MFMGRYIQRSLLVGRLILAQLGDTRTSSCSCKLAGHRLDCCPKGSRCFPVSAAGSCRDLYYWQSGQFSSFTNRECPWLG
ncbi:hypothetical protein PHLGIDRAFT_433190 [Phlebiopsis gigantea 11061_1 CR5-6]|uniref:Uncharacterized protein n=1 Tax=Phlebiopsis gigantea (strain 11061_1 CR5-6) TaxID=745531 RepID=A0A0C3S7V8_PHLG1|nr:hypothetical protein PHLGIDRAFT_433190 [Phlebiopsis gigantea 11061_1 CR5-6]